MSYLQRKLPLLFLLPAMSLVALGDEDQKIHVESRDSSYAVMLGDSLITELDISSYRKPILYPVMGPGGVAFTRNHPMKTGVAGEAEDHPHHKSIWFGHGDINGVSFWHEEGLIQVDKSQPIVVTVDDDGSSASISFHSRLVGPDDKLVCRDSTTISVGHDEGGAVLIDWDTTIHASEGPLKFGDTKEGTMAIRTHPSLRIDRGASAVNSNYGTGEQIWGKNAAWVDYSGKIDGKLVGVALFDHPDNLRHPTTWHARAYGLVAANPFGLSYFQGMPKGAGDLDLPEGDSIRFRYRLVFHEGNAEAAKIPELYRNYSNE